MLKRQDMESQKATAGALWPHHTRACIQSTSATSPCPPVSPSNRSLPWQSQRGSPRSFGTPSTNSPLLGSERGGLRCAWCNCKEKDRWSFLLHDVQGKFLRPRAESLFLGISEGDKDLHSPSAFGASAVFVDGRRRSWCTTASYTGSLVTAPRWPGPGGQCLAPKWVSRQQPQWAPAMTSPSCCSSSHQGYQGLGGSRRMSRLCIQFWRQSSRGLVGYGLPVACVWPHLAGVRSCVFHCSVGPPAVWGGPCVPCYHLSPHSNPVVVRALFCKALPPPR